MAGSFLCEMIDFNYRLGRSRIAGITFWRLVDFVVVLFLVLLLFTTAGAYSVGQAARTHDTPAGVAGVLAAIANAAVTDRAA
jgi:hypothetical protein